MNTELSNQPKAWLIQLRHKAQGYLYFFVRVSFIRLEGSEKVLDIRIYLPTKLRGTRVEVDKVKLLSEESVYSSIKRGVSDVAWIDYDQVPSALSLAYYSHDLIDEVELDRKRLLTVVSDYFKPSKNPPQALTGGDSFINLIPNHGDEGRI